MANEKSGSFSIDDLMQPGFWDRHRNRLLGSVLLIGIALCAVLFFQQQGASSEASAWDALVTGGRVRDEVAELDQTVGTAAEPWAVYVNAQAALRDEKLDDAIALLEQIQARFPKHQLCDSIVPSILQATKDERAWKAAHPEAKDNPDISEANSIVLKTAVGDIRIGLYPQESPAATKALLDLIRSGDLANSTFNEAAKDRYLVWSPAKQVDEDSAEPTPESASEGGDQKALSNATTGALSDRNFLSHFAGSVSFRRRPADELGPDARPQVVIYLDDAPDRDDEEVVFGRVMDGLEKLKQVAEREAIESGSTLKEPLLVDSIAEGADLKSIQ